MAAKGERVQQPTREKIKASWKFVTGKYLIYLHFYMQNEQKYPAKASNGLGVVHSKEAEPASRSEFDVKIAHVKVFSISKA